MKKTNPLSIILILVAIVLFVLPHFLKLQPQFHAYLKGPSLLLAFFSNPRLVPIARNISELLFGKEDYNVIRRQSYGSMVIDRSEDPAQNKCQSVSFTHNKGFLTMSTSVLYPSVPVALSPVDLSTIFSQLETITAIDDQTRQIMVSLASSLERDKWMTIFRAKPSMPRVEALQAENFNLSLMELNLIDDVLSKARVTGWSKNIEATALRQKINESLTLLRQTELTSTPKLKEVPQSKG